VARPMFRLAPVIRTDLPSSPVSKVLLLRFRLRFDRPG